METLPLEHGFKQTPSFVDKQSFMKCYFAEKGGMSGAGGISLFVGVQSLENSAFKYRSSRPR